jgi:hypothetical protein
VVVDLQAATGKLGNETAYGEIAVLIRCDSQTAWCESRADRKLSGCTSKKGCLCCGVRRLRGAADYLLGA